MAGEGGMQGVCMAEGYAWRRACMVGDVRQERWLLNRAVRILLECILVKIMQKLTNFGRTVNYPTSRRNNKFCFNKNKILICRERLF